MTGHLISSQPVTWMRASLVEATTPQLRCRLVFLCVCRKGAITVAGRKKKKRRHAGKTPDGDLRPLTDGLGTRAGSGML